MSQIDITRKIATYKKKINVKDIDRARNEYIDEDFVSAFDYFSQERRVVLFKKKKIDQRYRELKKQLKYFDLEDVTLSSVIFR